MRARHRTLLGGLVVAVAVLGARAPQARAEAWKDEKLGYSFSYPNRWTAVPVDSGDWLVAKFNSNREYDISAKDWWGRHRPYIEVVVIPFSAKDDKGATVDVTAKEVKVTLAAPWKNLKEYMDKTYQSRNIGGFHFSAETETTVGGLKCRQLEITVDKLVQGERRIFGWEYATEDAFYGFVAEILVSEEKKLKPEILQSFASFKAFPRKGSLGTRTGDEIIVKNPDKKGEEIEVTPEQIKKDRDDATARALSRIKENLGKDWAVVEGKNFVAVTHSDPKYTREVLTHAEALRAWLEEKYGYVGSGYVGKIIIRICADNNEHSAFLQAKRRWDPSAPEIFTYKDKEGWSYNHLSGLNQSLYYWWMRDKNERLLSALPRWLEFGISDMIWGAKTNNGKLEFKSTTWESLAVKSMKRGDDLHPVRSFFSMTSQEFWALEGAPVQTQFFINFLVLGAGSRNPKYKNVLSDYLKNLIFLLDSERPTEAEAKVPQNEEEEAAMMRSRQEAWRAREREVLDKLLEKTFPGWTDKDWDAFNSAFRQSLK